MIKTEYILPILIRARLLQMLAAIERIGGAAVSLNSLNAFAYFSNVLSPLWDIEPVEGSVLKDGAPRFPLLERELDRLVGEGLVRVERLSFDSFTNDTSSNSSLFRIDIEKANPILGTMHALPDEVSSEHFFLELASAFLDIGSDLQDNAAQKDAAYSDPSVSNGRVVDFAEWVSSTKDNASWNVAQQFQKYVPNEVTLTRAEKLVMYMNLMKRRSYA